MALAPHQEAPGWPPVTGKTPEAERMTAVPGEGPSVELLVTDDPTKIQCGYCHFKVETCVPSLAKKTFDEHTCEVSVKIESTTTHVADWAEAARRVFLYFALVGALYLVLAFSFGSWQPWK